ncbi:MAG: DUF4358 domain-containing protein [Oscillospiraceae bacterium]|nr:DUF4358 domain-containing protein [Oscillospiraceae bacterium]
MKRIVSLLLSLTLLLSLLPGCSQSREDPPAPTELFSVQELAEAVFPVSGREEALDVERLNRDADSDRLAVYIEAVCGLTQDQWEDAAVIRGTGASAFEIIVLRLETGDAAADLEPVLADYLTAREGAFTGYAPAEAEMASNGRVQREERTLGLFICPAPENAAAAFTAAYNGEAMPAPPEPKPEPEPERNAPPLALRDILFRLLLEAACPEWGSLRSDDRYWMSGKSSWSDKIEQQYGIQPEEYEDYTAGNWESYESEALDETAVQGIPQEVVLFLAAGEDAAAALAEALDAYRESQAETFRDGGNEETAAVWENGRAAAAGCYAVLIVSKYAEDAALLFPRIVSDPDTNGYFQRYIDGSRSTVIADPDPDYPDRVRFTPPNEEDMSIYDTSAILAAWEAGDPSGLSGDDREIYDAAKAILAEIMEDGMSGLEKETAAYRWLVNNVDYDWSHQDALAETDRRAYGPYGGLVDRTAVCLGYAVSFQLLMDMSGVECITVVGAGFNSTGDHAWNMVKLDGEWYCVDATWDANAREQRQEEQAWRYFNLTSDEMARNHQWDYANTPEATAEDRGGARA